MLTRSSISSLTHSPILTPSHSTLVHKRHITFCIGHKFRGEELSNMAVSPQDAGGEEVSWLVLSIFKIYVPLCGNYISLTGKNTFFFSPFFVFIVILYFLCQISHNTMDLKGIK